jgi:glycosyltransferase EpsE
MQSSSPTISILMGAYNCASTLEGAIHSILNQTYHDWEFIICDDGSKDNTWKILSEYKDHPQFVIIKNEKNIGLAATLNECFKYSKGKYLVRQDADDKSLPQRLERLVDYADAHPEVDVIGSNAYVSDGSDECWGAYMTPEIPVFINWAKGTQIIHACALINRNIFEKAGGYDATAIRVEDYDLWMRIIHMKGIIRNLQEKLYIIQWGEKDYKRKTISDRIREIKFKLKLIGLNKMSLKAYLFLIKPLILIFVPNKILFKYHYFSMKKNMKNEKN